MEKNRQWLILWPISANCPWQKAAIGAETANAKVF